MNTLTSALAFLLASAVQAQDKPAEESREVRIFVLDRTTPDRELKDAAAVLTVERKSGRGETLLFPRAPKDAPTLPENAEPGLIRGLVSTPYFVELNLGGPAPARGHEEAKKPEPAPAPADGAAPANTPLPSREILRRAHKGTWFVRKVPASTFAEPFTATVTIRLGNLTFTSEEFQGPAATSDKSEEVAARVDRGLQTLRDRAKESAGFMDLKPAVAELMRDLSKLAPAGFQDDALERDRQWCLALARAIEQACYQENRGRIDELAGQCGPRMKDIHDRLAKSPRKEPEPVPTPAAPEAPPNVK